MSSKGAYTVQYLPFIEGRVKKLSNRFGQRYDYDDMLSVATLASLLAEASYDPERSEFSGYIKKHIDGAVIRSVTTSSSKQQSLLINVYRWIETYTDEHDAVPSIGMALKALNIVESDYLKATASSEYLFRVPMDDVDPVSEPSEDTAELEDAIARLPRKYRRVVEAYLEDRPFNQSVYKTALTKLKQLIKESE